EMMSAKPRPGSGRRVLSVLPVVVLLAAAGCSAAPDEQSVAEQETVTATVTAPVESRFDNANCSTDRTGQDISGDVHVRDGQTCLLSDLTVTGDIDVHSGGRLELHGVRVTEDVEAEGHAFVLVSGGEVSGSIELEHGGEAVVENVTIGGSLELEANSGPQRFEGNTIGDDLECNDNTHTPTGGANRVAGEREGQCAGL